MSREDTVSPLYFVERKTTLGGWLREAEPFFQRCCKALPYALPRIPIPELSPPYSMRRGIAATKVFNAVLEFYSVIASRYQHHRLKQLLRGLHSYDWRASILSHGNSVKQGACWHLFEAAILRHHRGELRFGGHRCHGRQKSFSGGKEKCPERVTGSAGKFGQERSASRSRAPPICGSS
jgi:hypothetical protein